MALLSPLDVTIATHESSRPSLIPLPSVVLTELLRLDRDRKALRSLLKLAMQAHGSMSEEEIEAVDP